jgi:hypothetical protein
VRCIFRPAGLPHRALHFSTGDHKIRPTLQAAGDRASIRQRH